MDDVEDQVQAQVREGVEPDQHPDPDQAAATNTDADAAASNNDASAESTGIAQPISSTAEAEGEGQTDAALASPPAQVPDTEPMISDNNVNAMSQPGINNGMTPMMGPGMGSVNNMMNNGISADEIALYDRQIRLWGVQAQEKIRNANILLVTLKGLGNEIAKNLVLAGVASITLIDNAIVTDDDLGAQFFISENDIGKSRAVAASVAMQQLNPRVNVNVAYIDLFSGDLDPNFFGSFSLVIATDMPMPLLEPLSTACRFQKVPYYAAGSHGLYGFIFADLIEHTYAITRDKPNKTTVPGTAETATRTIVDVVHSKKDGKDVELVTKTETYTPLLLANSAPLPSEYYSSPRRLRTVTPLLPCLRALWDFEKQNQGMPPSHSSSDLQLFTRLATQNSQQLSLPGDLLKSDFLRSFLQNLYAEISPSCAFLGGLLAQDVINVLGGREQPLQNMVLWDGEESKAGVYALVPMVQSLDSSL